ncbi:MAG: guanylate kinase [Elusimicrobiota bacterium]
MIKQDKIYNIIKAYKREGELVVISAPSGTGKTTLCRHLLNRIENSVFSVSVTSRPPRGDEIDGEDYNFVGEEEFKTLIKEGKLLEWAKVHGYYYGTSKEFVRSQKAKGKDIILDIDVQGGVQIKKQYPQAVLIFVIPPSVEELENRLRKRSQNSETEIQHRLENADEELNYVKDYDYLVINNKLEEAVKELVCIVETQRAKI